MSALYYIEEKILHIIAGGYNFHFIKEQRHIFTITYQLIEWILETHKTWLHWFNALFFMMLYDYMLLKS